MKDDAKAYTLSLKAAADLLGKSERTIQRYAKTGRLSFKYVSGQRGRELRFNKEEVLNLATTVLSGNVPGRDDSRDMSEATERFSLNINELLQRHEQAMFRLGQLETKLQEVKMLEERARSLTEEKEQLTHERQLLIQEKGTAESKVKELTEALEQERQLSSQKEQQHRVQLRRILISYGVAVVILLLAAFLFTQPGQEVLGVLLNRLQ